MRLTRSDSVERDIASAEKQKGLSHPAERTIENNSLLKTNLCILKPIKDTDEENERTVPVPPLRLKRFKNHSVDVENSIVHRPHRSSSEGDPQSPSSKKVRAERNSDYKLKRSPPPEEDWLGRGSTKSDNDGSANKHDSPIARCRLAVSNHYAERQSIAKSPKEHIFKISPHLQELADPIAVSIRVGSVPERSYLDEHLEKRLVKVDESEEILRDRVIEVQETETALKKPVVKIKDSKELLNGSIESRLEKETLTNQRVKVGSNDSSSTHSTRIIDEPEASEKCSKESLLRLTEGRRRCLTSKRLLRNNTRMKLTIRLIRIRDKLVLGLSAFAIVFTLLLVMDLQMDLGYSGHHLTPSHARIRVGDPPNADTVYNNFRRKFLQRANNGSREQANGDAMSVVDKSGKNEATPPTSTSTRKRDNFADLLDVVVNGYGVNVDEGVARISGEDREYNPTIGDLRKVTARKNSTTLDKFHLQISRLELYPKDSEYVDQLLYEIATKPILHVVQKDGGTQLKLIIDYGDNMQALFKPMRFPREQQTLPNHFYFTDFERHTAEIASFHLDRLLGFRRAMPVSGRTLNVTTEIYQIADGELLKTFFVSPAGNLCFHGKCSYYCDTAHAVCGSPDTLEGSFAAFLPDRALAARKAWRHPWRRSYHKRKKAQWEHGE
ncbi:extracellular serine/threonine protein CG31145 isoform X2 [Ooceraea biroi]|uniref:extracellular serine/threonine protein CG31145 isoform X2 n=1 Tax=Ooceraea biroi TaxID=2015173 RepID=UPI0005BD868F|nr:extracellular serine/threonine protein CG31145 isoform X2 [Ooceraea biroi]